MYCIHCHKYIDASTEKCPHCGKKQANKQSNGFLNILLRIFLGIIIWMVSVAVLAALGTALHFPDTIYAISVVVIPVVIAVVVVGPKRKAAATMHHSVSSVSTPEPASDLNSSATSNSKRPFYKNGWFWIILLAVLLLANSNDTNEEIDLKDNDNVASISSTKSLQDEWIESTVLAVKIILDDSLEGTGISYDVYYQDEIFTLNIWGDGYAECATHAASGRRKYLKIWQEAVEVVESDSYIISNTLSQLGYPNVPVSVNFLSELDPNVILISALNGDIIYNCVALSEEKPSTSSVSKNTPIFSRSDSGSSSGISQPSAHKTTYVLNTDTKKFHYSSCSFAPKSSSGNKSTYTGTRAEVIAKGYSPCGHCDP